MNLTNNISQRILIFFFFITNILTLVCSGYMSPEYAMHEHFSVKSDVYNFGVLILEILSGNKISSLYQSDTGTKDLLNYVSINHILNIFSPSVIAYITSNMETPYEH